MERTDQQPQRPTPPPTAPLAPQPNRILAEPATPAACQQDYQAAANVRRTMANQAARQR